MRELCLMETVTLERTGRWFFHKHKWIPLSKHPRGGEVAFFFMLEEDERDKVEMCITCPARRIKK